MPRTESDSRITLSVLDRLIDSEPARPADPPRSRSRSLRELKNAVRRDLEWLLNSRRQILPLAADMEQTEKSVFQFGLPDFSAASVKNPTDQVQILHTLQEAIDLFEPRLSEVEVYMEGGGITERSLRFRIEAQLLVDPEPEPVTFDTTLQLYSGEYQVREEE